MNSSACHSAAGIEMTSQVANTAGRLVQRAMPQNAGNATSAKRDIEVRSRPG